MQFTLTRNCPDCYYMTLIQDHSSHLSINHNGLIMNSFSLVYLRFLVSYINYFCITFNFQ
jgi:hypothetical protein